MDKVKEEILVNLVGEGRYEVFVSLCDCINGLYSAETQWNRGGKKWDYEYKYRMGAKTLCAFYFRKECLGFMVILGKTEQATFEQARLGFSQPVQSIYDASKVYHDGRWLMFLIDEGLLEEDIIRLLAIKRRPSSH